MTAPTILDRVVAELGSTHGPVRAGELASRLGMAESALEGMLGLLERKGVLVGGDQGTGVGVACSGTACGSVCTGIDKCAFMVSAPRTHHLVIEPAR